MPSLATLFRYLLFGVICLCAFGTFTASSQREKIRALLHVAYSKSLHDDYYQARDLMHTPNIQELAMQTDVSTQILYNRNLVQLGLCAFRNGLIQDAHACLSQICPKHKELLAQGLSSLKNMERTQEQERAEKRRLLPYHMHISMELIECVHNMSVTVFKLLLGNDRSTHFGSVEALFWQRAASPPQMFHGT